MAYLGRTIILGNIQGNPFAAFILESKSEPDRSLVYDSEAARVWVAPGKTLSRKIADKPYMAVNQLYACLVTCNNDRGETVVSAFNGRMNNRVEALMATSSDTVNVLSQVLPVFPPIPGDPRLVGIATATSGGLKLYVFGAYDRSNGSSLHINSLELGYNEFAFISAQNHTAPVRATLYAALTPSDLAEQIFHSVTDPNSSYACGAAVGLITLGGCEFGVYNKPK